MISLRAPVGDVNINPYDEICIGRGLAAIRISDPVSSRFVFEFIRQRPELFKGRQLMTFDSISTEELADIKIPIPQLDVQVRIMAEFQAIDDEVVRAEKKLSQLIQIIQTAKAKTEACFSQGREDTLGNLVYINRESIDPTQYPDQDFIYVDISSVEKETGLIDFSQVIKWKDAPSRARRRAPKKSVIISTVRPNLRGFAFIDRDTKDCVFSTGFAVMESKDESILKNKAFFMFLYI